MKKAILLTVVLLGAGTAAWMAPAAPRSASLEVPDVVLIGQTDTAGSVRVILAYDEFEKDPNIDVHSAVEHVTIEHVTVLSNGTGTGVAQFTLTYTADAKAQFSVEVTAHDGTKGGGLNHLKSEEITFRRK